jgi:hypothetical protein
MLLPNGPRRSLPNDLFLPCNRNRHRWSDGGHHPFANGITGFGVRAKSSQTASGTISYRFVAKRIAGARLERVVIPTGKLQAASLLSQK